MTLKRKKRSQAIVLYVDGDQAFAYSYKKRGRGARLRAEGHSRLGQEINQIEPARLVDDLGGVFRQLSSTTKDCIVVLPAHLAPSIILTVPDISPEDRKGFIQIQAEQQLPLPLSEIHLATHEFQIGNQNHALVVGLRKDAVSKLNEAVIANGFQVASITVDIAGVVDHAVDGNNSLADSCQLIQGQSSLTMVTHAEGGPTGVRHFHLTNGGIDAATLERELRITLGQFPQSSQRQLTTLRTAKLPGVSSDQHVPISEHQLMAGLKVVEGTKTSDLFVPIASSFFLKGASPLEFLPSRTSRFGKMYGQFNSRRNLWVGLMSVVTLTAIAFLYQISRLDGLQKQWNGSNLAVDVASIEESGGTATLTTTNPHPFKTGDSVYISGATGRNKGVYNDKHEIITTTRDKSFTFSVASGTGAETGEGELLVTELSMKERVAAIKTLDGKNREFRSWFDPSVPVPSLTTARAITRAFPPTGEIWLKQLSIRDDSKITATGSSKDQNSLLAILVKLRSTSGISNLELKSQQGSKPISFSFEFDWNPAGVLAPAQL